MAQATQRHTRRALWFVSILFALVVCIAIMGATVTIRSGEDAMLRDVRSRLDAEARSKTAALTVWYGGLLNQVEALTRSDMFRLFASEVDNLGANIAPFLNAPTPETAAGTAHELGSQLPIMQKVLQNFVTFSGFSSARTFNQGLQEYLFTGAQRVALTPEQRQSVTAAFATGKSGVAPARMTQDGLVMDIACPVFAPQYVSSEKKPVSVLLLSYNIMDKLRELTQEGNDQSTRVTQRIDKALQELRPDGALAVLEGWTSTGEDVPLAVRRLDNAEALVFSLGVGVPGMPWTLVQTTVQATAQAAFETYRTMVILAASGATLFCLLLLGLFWWWLVWRRERTVSKELSVLYETVTQQKQLLDGINSTFPVGLVLTDANAVIMYVNAAFANMLGHTPETLSGLSVVSMLTPDAAKSLDKHLQDALQKGAMQPFTTTMHQNGKKNSYQIVCAPFCNEDATITGVVSAFQDITEVVEAQERSEHMVRQTIAVLVRAIEAVDPYLRGQSTHTGILAQHLVQSLGLGSIDKTTVLTAANLFQIGMIQLPHTLLTKQGQLTPEERVQLEKHVDYAHEILADMDFGMPVLEAICQMYERLDGSGYPRHLKGDQIGIHARILAVANTFCALVRPRSYRMAKSVPDALHILSVEPPLFDPQIVLLLQTFLHSPSGEQFVQTLQEAQ
ncbi:MAG: HD domain-containing phosphohydrolase [Bilophila sp.]